MTSPEEEAAAVVLADYHRRLAITQDQVDVIRAQLNRKRAELQALADVIAAIERVRTLPDSEEEQSPVPRETVADDGKDAVDRASSEALIDSQVVEESEDEAFRQFASTTEKVIVLLREHGGPMSRSEIHAEFDRRRWSRRDWARAGNTINAAILRAARVGQIARVDRERYVIVEGGSAHAGVRPIAGGNPE